MSHIKTMLAVLALVLVGVSSVFATADTNVTALITDASDTWGTIRPFVITLGLFFFGYALFKRLKRS